MENDLGINMNFDSVKVSKSLPLPQYFVVLPSEPIPFAKQVLFCCFQLSSPLTFYRLYSMVLARRFHAASSREFSMMIEPVFANDFSEAPVLNEEIKAEILAAFGAWADRDDIPDDWLDSLRQSWTDRLDEIYNLEVKDSNL